MILGTVVKISTAITCDNTIDSVTISIYDKTGTAIVTNQTMTDDGDNNYHYLFQSSATGVYGPYKAMIIAVSGSYSARSKKTFTLDRL